MEKWKVLSSTRPLDEKWMQVQKDVVKLPNGKILDDFYLWLEGDVALVVPVTREGNFILVKQYKHAAEEIMIEFPAGYLDGKEDPIKAALRELKEETGYQSDDLIPLAKLTNSSTKARGNLHVFLARNCYLDPKDQQQDLDETEEIEVVSFSATEIQEQIKTGQIRVTGTIAAFYLAKELL